MTKGSKSGFAIWLTGLPSSGKTTLAYTLKELLMERGIAVQILDSDDLRKTLIPQPAYSTVERDWFYRRLVYLAEQLTQDGKNVIISATAHRKICRTWARNSIKQFMEVYVRCSLNTCMARDQKGIYAKGMSDQSTTVPGLQVSYEIPETPEVVVDTEQRSPEECAQQILFRLEELSFNRGRDAKGSSPTSEPNSLKDDPNYPKRLNPQEARMGGEK